MTNEQDQRIVDVPSDEAQLEAFKGVLLIALARLPGSARSELARHVQQEADHLRAMCGWDPSRLTSHLEEFARIARLMPVSVDVEAVRRASRKRSST